MSRELVTPGSPITWAFLDRSFGGRAVELLKVSDGRDGLPAGTATWSNSHNFTGGLTKAGKPVLNTASLLPSAFVGAATSPASVAVASAVVGDTVVGVINMTTGAPDTTHFEAKVSVAGHIQQLTGAGDLSADKFMVLLAHQS